jgi:hypothetical protein
MRIGEVAVLSPPGVANESFIKAVCSNSETVNKNLCFGHLRVNEQLALHLYGINVDGDYSAIAWDMLSTKILGYIVIFDWEDYNSLAKIHKILDFLSTKLSVPIIIVAQVSENSEIPLSEKFFLSAGISISQNHRFSFCQISDPERARKIVAVIIDILLKKLP